MLIRDPSADDWVVDRFYGNSSAGSLMFQGMATEASSGVGRIWSVATAPDGRVFMAVPGDRSIVEVSPEGVSRLILGGGVAMEGRPGEVAGGTEIAWNPKDNMLYVSGRNCIRRLSQKNGEPWVEVVAGTPEEFGRLDGPAAKALIGSFPGYGGTWCFNSRGALFFYDLGDQKKIRASLRVLENGVVTTLLPALQTGKLQDGSFEDAKFNFINLGGKVCVGENDDTLYMADHWNYAARKIDLKNRQVTTIFGIRQSDTPALKKRFNNTADGPALTQASSNSGCTYVMYDPFREALWLGGPDEPRNRWLTKDGWVRTVIGAGAKSTWNRDAQGIPADDARMTWNIVTAIDSQGRVYIGAGDSQNGIFRARNTKEKRP